MDGKSIWIVENNTSDFWNEPEVFTSGQEATNYVRREFDSVKEEINDPEYEFDWQIYGFTGVATIKSPDGLDYWDWRITEHTI